MAYKTDIRNIYIHYGKQLNSMDEYFSEKEEIAIEIAEAASVDVYFLLNSDHTKMNDLNIKYLTELSNLDYAMVVATGEEACLYLTEFNYEAAHDSKLERRLMDHDIIGEYAANPDIKTVGLNFKSLTAEEYIKITKKFSDSVKFVDISPYFVDKRAIKTDSEIESLKRSVYYSEMGFYAFKSAIKPGVSETEIAAEAEYAMKKAGATAFGFDTIVAAGSNSTDLHHLPGSYRARYGDTVICDYGGSDGYMTSDVTRTFIIGDPDERTRDIYNTVLEANKRAISAARPGMTLRELDSIARDYIESRGYTTYTNEDGKIVRYFKHGLSHGLGIEVHDNLTTGDFWSTVLRPGMVITIEPGIYDGNNGIGVRIEDDIVITEDGAEILTKNIPKEIDDIIIEIN